MYLGKLVMLRIKPGMSSIWTNQFVVLHSTSLVHICHFQTLINPKLQLILKPFHISFTEDVSEDFRSSLVCVKILVSNVLTVVNGEKKSELYLPCDQGMSCTLQQPIFLFLTLRCIIWRDQTFQQTPSPPLPLLSLEVVSRRLFHVLPFKAIIFSLKNIQSIKLAKKQAS